jgi:hypothetical protein
MKHSFNNSIRSPLKIFLKGVLSWFTRADSLYFQKLNALPNFGFNFGLAFLVLIEKGTLF